MVILLIILGIKMCVPAYAVNSQMKTVDYYDPTDSANPYKTQEGCIPVTASTAQLEDGKWYVVDEDVEISARIKVTGNVNLILSDEKTLIASSGITVPENASFTVWAQSDGEKTGSLIAKAQSGDAGIGGTKAAGCGNIIINGGKISATGAHPEQRVLWENDGSHGEINWSGEYRFAPAFHPTGEEITCISEEDWDNYIKNGTIHLLFEGEDPQVRVTTGWWSQTYADQDFFVGSMTEDSQTGWYIMEINIKEDGRLCDYIDDQHLLFTGGRYTPKKLLGISHPSAGIGGGYSGNGGNVTINGGEVCASSEENSQAIGYGDGGSDAGELIALGMRAYVYEGNELVPVMFSNFETACRSKWVKLLKCDSHEYVDGKCKWCGGAEIKYSVTFKVVNGYWNDRLIEDKAITLSRCNYDNKELVLEEKDIPSVGNYPGEDCKEGKWDTEPVAGIIVTKDLEFTYTYAPKEVPQYIVPKDLTAAYGQTLKSVTLPNGWEWNDAGSEVGNVGEHAFGAKFTPEDTDNYVSVETRITVKVTAIMVSVTAGSLSKEYDGTPLTAETYTQEGLLEGDRIASITITGSQTGPGSCDNVPSAAKIVNADGEDVTDCYDITYVNGKLTVAEHSFDKEVADAKYQKSAADCTHAAVYYKSCSKCGAAGTETFESGEPLGHTWKAATGYAPKTCEICGATEGDVIKYTVEGGNIIEFTQGDRQDITKIYHRSEDDKDSFAHYVGVQIDGKDTKIEARSGSIILEFDAKTLNSLSVGEHVVTVVFDDWKDEMKLIVKAPAEEEVKNSPPTGDSGRPILWITLLLLSVAGTSAVVMRRSATRCCAR